MVEINALIGRFHASFGVAPRVFSAPGRVNLIGEHTDYNDGYVLPFAIERRTYVLAAARADRRIRARSENLDAEVEVDLDRPGAPRRGGFIDYVEGVVRALLADGVPLAGAELWIASDVPPGAGLSASAALELAVGVALATLAGRPLPAQRGDRLALALAGQRAEHTHVGTLCGIMDQYAAALGKQGHALLIDCRSLSAELVPLPANARIVVSDTRVRHALATSEYNLRRAECAEAVALFGRSDPAIRALRDVTPDRLHAARGELSDRVFQRCRHVLSENARVLAARDALRAGDLPTLGALLSESHRSLRDDYAVSCPELDCAVEAALSVPGVYGARMTGGGFGGSIVSLCEPGCVEALQERVHRALDTEFGIAPEQFVASAAEGARVEDE
jgi:galactokinase